MANADNAAAPVELKAVDDRWPLYGTLDLDDGRETGAPSGTEAPDGGSVAVPAESDSAEPPVADGEAAPPVSSRGPSAAKPGGAMVLPTSVEAAVSIVRQFYAALDSGDFERAVADFCRGDGGADEPSVETVLDEYGDASSVTTEIGEPGRIEGAAGSRYVEIPVTVRSVFENGTERCESGSVTLRRSEVPGATTEQLNWRIYRTGLAPCSG